MELIAASICFLIAYLIYIRAPAYSVGFLYTLFLGLSLLALSVVTSGLISGSRVLYIPAGTIRAGADMAVYIYLLQASLCLAAVYSTTNRTQNKLDVSFGSARQLRVPMWLLTGLASTAMLAHAVDMNWSAASFTPFYLAMNEPAAMGIDGLLGIFFHNLMTLTLLVFGPLTVLAIRFRMWVTLPFLVAVFAYCFLYQAASHSRAAGLSLVVLGGAMLFVLERRKQLGVAPLLLGIPFYFGALVGRNSGEHGLSTLGSYFNSYDLALLPDYIITAVYTIFEGAMGTAQAANINGSHPLAYKVLSFSPLPSILDGFATVRGSSEIRISWNVPLGSWSEAMLFGPGFVALLSVFTFGLVRANTTLVAVTKGYIPVTLSLATTFILVMTNAYPIRNSFRVLIILLIVQMFVEIREKARRRL